MGGEAGLAAAAVGYYASRRCDVRPDVLGECERGRNVGKDRGSLHWLRASLGGFALMWLRCQEDEGGIGVENGGTDWWWIIQDEGRGT